MTETTATTLMTQMKKRFPYHTQAQLDAEVGRRLPSATPPEEVVEDIVDEDKVDDLTQIKGIGERTAALLAQNGIVTFEQIAAMSENEAVELDTRLELKGRVYRQEWVDQAKKLSA